MCDPLSFHPFPHPICLIVTALHFHCRVDDMKLESFEGLGIIPIDILQQGTKKIVEFVLDLFRSPSGDPLFRSKLMVVGYESVGKTTILDCLFPLEGYLTQQGKLLKTKYWFELQGNTLRKYEKRGDAVPHKDKVIVFENRQWRLPPFPRILESRSA